MAQEPSSKDLLDDIKLKEAVKQQESGGRRYKADGKTLLEGPMTKYGTAKGEMQVLDMTTKDPGYGVKPAKDDSADERARVGRDYLNAMVKKYGDRQTALVAYNWGPGNTDKWLKKGGDFSKLPAETQNYVTKITGALGETKLARASAPATAVAAAAPKPKSGLQRAVYKAAPLTHPMLSQLGPNFQAAMAVSMLADEGEKEGKSENEPSEAEKMLTETAARPVALASADLGYQSPFPVVAPKSSAPAKQQLQSFKHGGAVHMADGGDLNDSQVMENRTVNPEGTGELWGPNVPVSRSAEELKAYTEAMNPAVKTFTGGLGMGTRGYIYSDQPDVINLNTALSPGEREITTLHELEHSMDARGGDIYGRPNFAKLGGMDNNYRAYSLMGDRWDSIEDTVKNMVDNREKLEKFFGRPLDNSYFRKDSYDNLKKVGKQRAMFSEQLASLSALEQTTGKFLTQDPEMRELFPNYKMMAVYDALTGPRQTRMDARDLPPHTPVPSYTYVQNPVMRGLTKALTGENEYGTSYRPFPIKRADGGEVGYFQDPMGAPSAPITADTFAKGKEFKAADALRAAKEVGRGVVRTGKAIAQGVSETPYNLLGGVADVGNMVLTPLGLGSAEPALGSAHLKRLALERGIRQAPPTDPRDLGFYTMGELGASVVNPGPIAAKGGKAAEMLAKDFQTYNQALGPAGVAHAVRNKGTPFIMVPSDTRKGELVDQPLKYAESAVKEAKYGITDLSTSLKPEELHALRAGDADLEKWFMNRVPSYLRRDFATPEDQFVKAAEEGKLLHFEKKPSKYNEGKPLEYNTTERVKYNRKSEGFSPEGEAKTSYGQRVETLIDASMYPARLEDLASHQVPPSLLKADPESTRVSELSAYIDDYLELPNLYTEMARMRNMGPTYSAYGQPAVKVPENYFLKSKTLEGMTLPQASQRVAQFKNWRDENRQRMASKALLENPALDPYRNNLPDGNVAVSIPDLNANPQFMELAKDVGCDGKWCTKEELTALDYGSGNNELHLIVSPKGRPMAQLTLTALDGRPGTAQGNSDLTTRFLESIDKDPQKANEFFSKYDTQKLLNSDEYVMSTPEFKEYLQKNPPRYSISEIKGWGNVSDISDNKALSDIQKYIQQLDAQYNLKGISGLRHTGLTELDTQILMSGSNELAARLINRNANSPEAYADFSTARALAIEKLKAEVLRQNNGSKYFTGGDSNIRKIVQNAIDDLSKGTPTGRATGGMVERQPSTARYI